MKIAQLFFFSLLLVCFFALSIQPGQAQAQSRVTIKVLASEGQVEVHRDAKGRLRVENVAFKVNDDLFAGDTIITGKNGRMVLALSDGSQAVIAPKTTLVVQDLQQEPRTLFQLLKGKTRVHIEKLGGQPNPYRVNTPTAVIAVRGTVFDVLVEDAQTEVFLHEGAVDVFNQGLPAQPVFLNAGQTTRVFQQRAPNAPVDFKMGRNDGMFQMREMRNQGIGNNPGQRAGNGGPNGRGDQGAAAPGDNRTASRGQDRGPQTGTGAAGQPVPNTGSRPQNGPTAGPGGGPRRP